MDGLGILMQNGLGRTGYLLLATIMFVIGLLGLAGTYLAYLDGTLRFFQIGIGLTAVAMTGVFAFAFYAPWLAGSKPQVRVRPVPVEMPPRDAPAQRPPTQAAPTTPPAPSPAANPPASGIDFEFNDATPANAGHPTNGATAAPAGNAAATRPPMPRQTEARDPAAWPERRRGAPTRRPEKSDWSAQMEQKAKVQAQIDESRNRKELQERYTQDAPTVRGILTDPPLHVADRAPEGIQPGFAAPGMNVGKCGRCDTVVMAPTTRPLRLKCPECAKVTLLA